jgi:hypothetical protein
MEKKHSEETEKEVFSKESGHSLGTTNIIRRKCK